MDRGRASLPVGHALAGLPAVVFELMPELESAVPGIEPLADCSDCVMLPRHLGDSHPWSFTPDTRCCTYHPELPNYAVGSALERGGVAARVMRDRLGEPSGVSAHGVVPSERYQAARRQSEHGFGRDPGMRCPYWVGGRYTCGIWSERNAVCRTWFCKYQDGLPALARWTAARHALTHIEHLLAGHLVRIGEPPEPRAGAAVPVDAWCAWFTWCARAVHGARAAQLTDIVHKDENLIQLREGVRACAPLADAADEALPDIVVPVIRGSELRAGKLWLYGYSRYDCAAFEPSIIEFFARLDGQTPWQLALEHDGSATRDSVHELFRLDILQAPGRVLERAAELGMEMPSYDPSTQLPEILVPAFGRPIVVGERVWLQGAVPMGSVITRPSIFIFLSALNGRTPWRQVLARVCTDHDATLDEALIRSLVTIGALQSASRALLGTPLGIFCES